MFLLLVDTNATGGSGARLDVLTLSEIGLGGGGDGNAGAGAGGCWGGGWQTLGEITFAKKVGV